jgi:hydrophobe/amphiphile efflux-3 (HAE3) family protein
MRIKPLAKILVKRPKVVLIIFTLITLFIGSQASNIYMVSDFAEYLPRDDPTITLWDRIIEEFEIGSTIIILIDQDPNDGWYYEIRTPEVLKEMDQVVQMIDTNPNGIDDGVYSINSLSSLIKEENAKTLGGRKEIPSDTDDIYAHMGKLSITSMKGILYTDSYRVSVIIVQLSDDADFDEILARAERAVNNRGTKHANMTITGSVAMQKAIQRRSMWNLYLIFPIAIVLVSIVLFFFHRTIKGIIIAFLPPAFAIALTFGTLGILQPELSIISVAIIALLMGLGVDYSIHLMNRYAEESNIENKVERVEKILKFTGKAVLLSTVTTMIGFASLMISSMSPIITFGFGCAIGILFCFISAILIVPCLVIILNFEKKDHIPSWKKLAKFIINNRKRVIFIAIFFVVMSLLVIPQIKTDVDSLNFAPEGLPEVEAMYTYSENFGTGSNFNALLIETDPYGLSDPDVLEAIYNMEVEMREAIRDVFPYLDEERLEKSVYSIADEIKEITGLINRSAILQKLSELINAEEIIYDMIAENGVVDEKYSRTLILVAIPIGSKVEEINDVIKNINEIASRTILPHNGQVSHLTGQDAVRITVNNRLTDEQVRSMVIALILVLAALIVIFNSSTYGFLTLMPVLFVLMWEPGFLVALDIPLSLATISIAAIMVGVGIDYGVHITHRFREERSNGASKIDAIKISIERTGSSLVEAALTTIAGAGAIYIANTPALNQFVTVVLLMTGLSCVAAALILPVFYDLKFVK